MVVSFEELNKAQKTAVRATGKRILILAGPGTGKTEILGHRISYLVRGTKVDPSKILAITFTVKAAQEMRDRLRQFFPQKFPNFRILTLQGEACIIFCQNLLDRIFIADDDEKKMVLQDVFEDLGLKKSWKELDRVKKAIELSKADNKLVEDLKNSSVEFLHVFEKYENLMQFNRAVDFEGILTNTNRLFKKSEILEECQLNTKYLLVDEYQDINQAQFEFIRSLCHKDSELFCVGDDDQSIYGWRGAKPDFILNFEKDFETTQILPLEQTRRCSENI